MLSRRATAAASASSALRTARVLQHATALFHASDPWITVNSLACPPEFNVHRPQEDLALPPSTPAPLPIVLLYLLAWSLRGYARRWMVDVRSQKVKGYAVLHDDY